MDHHPVFDELMFFAQMKARPGLWMGKKSLLSLRDQIFGMRHAFAIMQAREKPFGYLEQFVEWYHQHVITEHSGYACWWNHLLYISGGFDEAAFDAFFKKFEAYLQEEHGLSLPQAREGWPVKEGESDV